MTFHRPPQSHCIASGVTTRTLPMAEEGTAHFLNYQYHNIKILCYVLKNAKAIRHLDATPCNVQLLATTQQPFSTMAVARSCVGVTQP